jgi:hypothetical protein
MSPGSTCDPDLPRLIELKGLRYPQKLPICRYLSPLPDSNRRPPPYHPGPVATGRNLRQRFGLVFASFGCSQFATDCHCLQPRGSIRAPSFVISQDNRFVADLRAGPPLC